jgi:hypothetical protein
MPDDPEVFEVDKQKYDDLAEGFGGICLACGEFYEGAIDPEAEEEECPSCGEVKLYGIEQAVYLERVRLVKHTGPLEIDARNYLLHAGNQCPVCQLPGTYRQCEAIRSESVRSVRVLLVPCWCTRCNATWVESYRLVGVHANANEAIASIKETSRPQLKPED